MTLVRIKLAHMVKITYHTTVCEPQHTLHNRKYMLRVSLDSMYFPFWGAWEGEGEWLILLGKKKVLLE